jgi:hypothetical protein
MADLKTISCVQACKLCFEGVGVDDFPGLCHFNAVCGAACGQLWQLFMELWCSHWAQC